jgi:hypothetical protein
VFDCVSESQSNGLWIDSNFCLAAGRSSLHAILRRFATLIGGRPGSELIAIDPLIGEWADCLVWQRSFVLLP